MNVPELRAHETAIARRAVELTYARVPEYARGLDALGRRRCEEDALFHVRFLVASLLVGDEEMFADYARWAQKLLATFGIESKNLIAMFDATRQAVGELAPADADAAGAHLAAATVALG